MSKLKHNQALFFSVSGTECVYVLGIHSREEI